MRLLPIVLVLVLVFKGHAQRLFVPDSLYGKSYMYFRIMLDNDNLALNKQKLYAEAYLAKAYSNSEWAEVMQAYKCLLYLSEADLRIHYADSMIIAAQKTKRNELIGSAYLTKGVTFYNLKNHKAALDSYLKADIYIARTNDQYLIHKLKYGLAETKYFLGYNESALSLFKECVSFYERDGGKPWLNSLHHLGLCYIKLGEYEICSTINEIGLRESIKSEYEDMVVYFTHSEGMNQYYQKNYKNAIQHLKASLPGLRRKKDMHSETVAYHYIAKSYVDLGQIEKALLYFYKVDEALINHNYIRKDLREGISILMDYYIASGNTDKALLYSKHLRKADSLLATSVESVSNKIHETNDEKINHLENERSYNRAITLSVGAIAILSCITGGFLQYRNRQLRKHFQQNYDNLIDAEKHLNEEKVQILPYSSTEMTAEKEAELFLGLQEFEKRHLFLGRDLTIMAVAKLLNTNTRYLTYIIRKYRSKMFVQYINDLKAEHAYHLLSEQKLYREYDQQSFAEILGFNTAQNLRRSFRKRYGFSTPFFIEQLSKEQIENQEN